MWIFSHNQFHYLYSIINCFTKKFQVTFSYRIISGLWSGDRMSCRNFETILFLRLFRWTARTFRLTSSSSRTTSERSSSPSGHWSSPPIWIFLGWNELQSTFVDVINQWTILLDCYIFFNFIIFFLSSCFLWNFVILSFTLNKMFEHILLDSLLTFYSRACSDHFT
jgi:hypothetical protein